ncbi:MAG: SMC family ATPase [Anaerolineae bacterium]|nr:SMC family ATPase [Anaerolineae bacterium]
MYILQIDLNNVKSYRQESVTFAPGTNAICGHNGAGKSTLLEAIGFALFDFLAVKQDDFVREGEKTATVTVHIADADGRVYHVVRRCGGSSQYYVYDPELDRRLTDGKTETVLWLREFLGVDSAADLTVLFRDAVGVPQGLLTAAFLETAGRRKDIFNPLLRVDEYERVWDALREPRRKLEHQIAGAEKRIAGLTAEVGALPDLRAQLDALMEQIAQNMQRQIDVQTTLEDVAARKARMEDLKTRLDALEKQVTQAEAALQTLAVRHAGAQAALERSEAAQAVIVATADAHQAYLTTEEQLAVLESERSARDKAQRAQQKCIHAQELAQQQLARLEQTLAAVADAEAEMAALVPQVEAQTRLEESLDEARRAVERLKAGEQALQRERQRLTEMKTRQSTLQTQLGTRTSLEAELQTAQAVLATHTSRREALAVQLSTQQADYRAVCERAKQAARQFQDAQHTLARGQQRQAELEARHAGVLRDLETLTSVEAQIETAHVDIAALDAQDRTYTAQLAAVQNEQERLHTQNTVLTAAETAECPVCGAALSPEHRDELLAQNRARSTELDAAMAEIQTQQSIAGKDRRAKERSLRSLEKQAKSLPRPAEAEDVAAQLIAHQHEVVERETAVAAVQAEGIALATRQTMLKKELDALQPQLAEVEAARDTAQTVVRDLEARLNILPRPVEVETLAAQVEAQHKIVVESEDTVAVLKGAPDHVARLETDLAALGNPKRAYQRAADIAAQREATAAQHIATVAQFARLEAQRMGLDAEVAAYAGLDTRFAAARSDRARYAPEHQRYLQHEREAAMLAERQTALATLENELQNAKTRWDARITTRDEVAGQYDGKEYAALVAQYGALREALAGLQAGLQHQQAQQSTLQDAIARLEARQDELDAVQAGHDELSGVLALLETLRQVLRDAGPEVTRALVEMISLHADRLYGEIMQSFRGQNPPARLRWTEDYDIVLTGEGADRTFQQLSGGEQMSAALAVRLALLREISMVDVAFFDEPTANLDRDRRTNLARQVLSLQGFGQLFVISHDDTFEQDTDFVVRVEKVGGESRVAV